MFHATSTFSKKLALPAGYYVRTYSARACLAEGDGPGFGHLPDFFSLFSPSPWFGDNFRLPDFFGDWPPNPATAGDGTDRATPVRGHAVLRVVVKRPLCPRAETLRLGSESSFCCLNLVMAKM